MSVPVLTFDKLAHVDRLKASGVDEPHARAHADALDAAFRDTGATKADVAVGAIVAILNLTLRLD